MKVLMAVSRDGFVAKGPDDDMKWTGGEDKSIFRLLTQVGMSPIGVGRKTFETMPQLRNRTLCPLSNDAAKGTTLRRFHVHYPGAWLIGGQTIVLEALRQEMIAQVFLCHVDRTLGAGVRLNLTLGNFRKQVSEIYFNGVRVEVRQ